MKTISRKTILTVGTALAVAIPLLLASIASRAANLPYVSVQTCTPDQIVGCINSVINELNSSMTTSSGATFGDWRNFLTNGSMQVMQRGTALQICGTTTVPSSSYSADRWGCNVNVTSGSAKQQVFTSNPPLGFIAYQTIRRSSGALLQPVCSIQEISSSRSTQLQGQQVTLSFQAQALAALAADNGNVINAVIITGTGQDEGLQTFTATPAFTPAWTGISIAVNQPFTITSSWANYQVSTAIPANTTEIGVMMCFTPANISGGSGGNDGFGFTAAQLEQGTSASTFEFHDYQLDLLVAERFYWQLPEPAAANVGAVGTATGANTCSLTMNTPLPMRISPTISFIGTALSGTTWKVSTSSQATSALSTPYLAVNTANSIDSININATLATATTPGFACVLTGAGGGSIIAVSSDF